MAREDLHFRLRIPEDLKARVEDAASANERSMTAEIIARLQWTFGPSDAEFDELLEKIAERDARIRELERERDEALGVNTYLEDLRKVLEKRLEDATEGDFSWISVPEDRTLYVLLDADGMPISWQEVSLHLAEIGRVSNFEIDKIESRIFSPKIASNDEREAKFWELLKKYRALRGLASSDE